MDAHLDKHWARKYISDPLTAPSPNQETGPGSSHVNQFVAAQDPLNDFKAQSPARARASGYTSKTPLHSFVLTTPLATSHVNQIRVAEEEEDPLDEFKAQSQARAQPFKYLSRPSRLSLNTATHPILDWSDLLPTPPDSASPTGKSPSSSLFASHSRNSSLNERFPGDMSHRPLDSIKRDARAAERARHHRRRISDMDMIDSLDTIGGFYHHGGPYDATLLSRNLDEKYSPLAAVHDSTMEALRATPREYIINSLEHHMPLQGTASVPPGHRDLGGNEMNYKEGADLMREPDAPGGSYKRWDGIKYHPDDLKGKGEPSYTFERDLKEKKKRRTHGESAEYEMKSSSNSNSNSNSRRRSRHHQHSASNAVPDNRSSDDASGLQRRSSTGKKLSEGLKRRLGGLGKKNH